MPNEMLHRGLVRLGASPNEKTEAITEAGHLLVDAKTSPTPTWAVALPFRTA